MKRSVLVGCSLILAVLLTLSFLGPGPIKNKAALFFEFPAYTSYSNGQGVYYIAVYDNATGSFVLVRNITAGMGEGAEITTGYSAFITVGVAINKTLLDWGSDADSLNYFNVSLTVTLDNGTQIYTASNLTDGGLYSEINNPIYCRGVNHTLNFLVETGFRYTVALDVDTAY